MKMGTEFWVEHVAAAKLETISASEYTTMNRRVSLTKLDQVRGKMKSHCSYHCDT
jgi:hypothetical protein